MFEESDIMRYSSGTPIGSCNFFDIKIYFIPFFSKFFDNHSSENFTLNSDFRKRSISEANFFEPHFLYILDCILSYISADRYTTKRNSLKKII